ncbi:hypothetical protein AX16_010287 [Volvariella volvacea WC 439]|nr:hypothetical protein AX16_010287 [Volvariella volvacea WC 439]
MLKRLVHLVRRAYFQFMTPAPTSLLRCDPDAITFPSSFSIPSISSPDTHQALIRASQVLRQGQCVAFPTETVYGLGALALEPAAASRIFSTKGRPADNPLIVHVSSFEMLQNLLPADFVLPRTYQVLTQHFWPGPLTLLFPTVPSIVPSVITANQPTVAIRMPSHPVARALIALTQAPLAAPSANSSGKPSPTRAEHVFRDLDGKLPLILDGGPCDVGLESTVIDGLHDDGNIRILRPGGVTVEDIQRVLAKEFTGSEETPKVLVHRRDYRDDAIEQAPTTPGMKYRHYSPSVPVVLLHTSSQSGKHKPTSFHEFLKEIRAYTAEPTEVGLLATEDSPLWSHTVADTSNIHWHGFTLGPSTQPIIAARRLFDGLLTLEQEGVGLIIVEAFEEVQEGLAIMNRLQKAASESYWVSLDK